MPAGSAACVPADRWRGTESWTKTRSEVSTQGRHHLLIILPQVHVHTFSDRAADKINGKNLLFLLIGNPDAILGKKTKNPLWDGKNTGHKTTSSEQIQWH